MLSKQKSVMCRGMYRCVCVELRIHFLLLNAVMVAAELAEVEGTALDEAQGGRTLKLLRDMLAGWAQDASAKCATPPVAGMYSSCRWNIWVIVLCQESWLEAHY